MFLSTSLFMQPVEFDLVFLNFAPTLLPSRPLYLNSRVLLRVMIVFQAFGQRSRDDRKKYYVINLLILRESTVFEVLSALGDACA